MPRKKPGNRARYKKSLRVDITDKLKGAKRLEVSESRRSEVYRSDVEFTGTEAPAPLPKKGTPERAALIAKIKELHDQGMPYIEIAAELNIDSVYKLLKNG